MPNGVKLDSGRSFSTRQHNLSTCVGEVIGDHQLQPVAVGPSGHLPARMAMCRLADRIYVCTLGFLKIAKKVDGISGFKFPDGKDNGSYSALTIHL